MKISRLRYQDGSERQVPGSQGFAWEFRLHSTDPDGERKLKVQTAVVPVVRTDFLVSYVGVQ